MRKIWQVVWLCGSLCIAVPAAAEEVPPEAGVVIPEMDVAENVRRMLEAARLEQGESAAAEAAERIPDSVPASASVPAVPVAPPPVIAAPPAQRPSTPLAPPARASDHVPLPERELTIRSLDDIRELARELEEARQRQQGKQKN